MKKSVLMIAAAAMTLAACTNTEEVESGSQNALGQIGFASHVNKNTRALDNTTLTDFYVSAAYTMSTSSTPVHILNGENVKKNDAGVWSYTNTRYWINGANYSFYAYSKENSTSANARFSNGQFSLTNYIVDAAPENQKDLVFASATATGAESGNKEVSFDFKHVLSKACFNFISNFPKDYTIDVTNVRIRNFRDRGTFAFANSEYAWGNVDRTYDTKVESNWVTLDLGFKENENMGMTTDPDKDGNREAVTKEFYVIPFAYTEANVRLRFTLTIKNSNGEEVSKTERYAAFRPTWVKGSAYRYNVTLTGAEAGLEEIKFTVGSVGEGTDGWNAGTGDIEFNFGTEVQDP